MKGNLSSHLIIALGVLTADLAHAESIEIVNPGLEEPGTADIKNVSFDGVHGGIGIVPGWSSDESSAGGIIRYDERYPGRTGSNVLYLHGSPSQNFHTDNFALPEDLQSNTTYVLTFDVLRWVPYTQDNMVIFRAGLFTGADYESRVPLKQVEGPLHLVDKAGNSLDKVTLTLVYTTGEVAPGTKFWIGGDNFGAGSESHRAHFDNFSIQIAVP